MKRATKERWFKFSCLNRRSIQPRLFLFSVPMAETSNSSPSPFLYALRRPTYSYSIAAWSLNTLLSHGSRMAGGRHGGACNQIARLVCCASQLKLDHPLSTPNTQSPPWCRPVVHWCDREFQWPSRFSVMCYDRVRSQMTNLRLHGALTLFSSRSCTTALCPP